MSHPVCGDGTNTPPILPEALPHSDSPAVAASRTQGCRGDGDFPWQGKEQEPINLSAGHTSGTLQEYFVPLAIFIKKNPFPGVVDAGVSARSFGAVQPVQAPVLCRDAGMPWNALPKSCQQGRESSAQVSPPLRHTVTALAGLRPAENCRGRGNTE